MATLTFLSESKGFRYESGNYTLTGNRVSRNGNFESVDGGAIIKGDKHIGAFYVRIETTPKITLSNVDSSEFLAAYEVLSDLVDELWH